MSENITAVSIVDKFLEHPRLFIFGTDDKAKIFMGSADFMPRNLDRRVEVTTPVYDENIKQELIDTFNISWNDNVKSRIFNKAQDNTYKKDGDKKIRSQFALYDYYLDKLK